MKITLENGDEWVDPNREVLSDILSSMGGSGCTYAILECEKDGHFMQVAGTVGEGFTVEYQAGRMDSHYRSEEDISMEEAIETLERYAKRDRRWRTNLSWKKVDRETSVWGKRLGRTFFVLIAIAVIIILGGIIEVISFMMALPVISVALAVLAVEEVITGEVTRVRLTRRSEEPFRFWLSIGYKIVVSIAGLFVYSLGLLGG